MDYRGHIPLSPAGLGVDQTWFCGGRLGVRVARHGGISEIAYFGRQPVHAARLFAADGVSAWSRLFRLCLVVDGRPSFPGFRDTELHPFGYRAQAEVDGVRIRHELVLLNDALVQRVEVLANPRGATLALRLVWHGHPVQVGGPRRTWSGFAGHDALGLMVATARDQAPPPAPALPGALTQCAPPGMEASEQGAETAVAVACDRGVRFRDHNRGFKHQADSDPFETRAAFLVAFAWDRAGLERRLAGLDWRLLHAQCDLRFAASAAAPGERQPAVSCGRPAVESFLAQLPGVVDALRVEDAPGAMRASAGHYWVWGWDSMVYSKGLMLAGRCGFVVEMLAFYRRLAHPDLGIPHCLDTAFAPRMAMAATAQTLYAVMLWNHWCAARDPGVLREYYPFARSLVGRALAAEVAGSGLIAGPSLFPDHPELVGHDGHDLSVFNNGIFYQALRCMADLAREQGDGDAAERFAAAAGRCRAGFRRVFFDAEAGYFVDSASARDFAPRRHHPGYAVLWVTPYARDLVEDDLPRIAAFMARELAAPRGVFHYPPADEAAFLSDGNQGSAGYPVIEPFYWNVMSLAGRGDELERWLGNLAWFWDAHTIPEGLTYDALNAGDLTPDCPGGKQPFAGKAWYEAFFTAYAGIELGIEGIELRPTPVTATIVIANLVLGGRRLDLHISGAGMGPPAVTLDGRPLPPGGRIPLAALGPGPHHLRVVRGGGA